MDNSGTPNKDAENMKKLAIDGLKLLALGVLIGAGVRAAEWAIPAPEMRVIVCTVGDFGRIEACTSAVDLLKKHADATLPPAIKEPT